MRECAELWRAFAKKFARRKLLQGCFPDIHPATDDHLRRGQVELLTSPTLWIVQPGHMGSDILHADLAQGFG